MGNSKAFVGMEIALCFFRLTTMIVFEIALMNFWRSLRTLRLLKPNMKQFVFHFILLTMYFIVEAGSLTLINLSYFADDMGDSSGKLFFINSLLWCVDGTVNFVSMLLVLDMINRHYCDARDAAIKAHK